MIRMVQATSSAHAKSYFSDALSKADYYINDQELQGQFRGMLADRLGITGTATKETFFTLCENINPLTGKALTPKTRDNRTIGYDINFHAPKSVSVLHILSKDTHILKAFEASVQETMVDVEADMQTRVRRNLLHEDRKTNELVYAEFTHQTARPVDDCSPDPHLHTHCFVINATWDDKEKKIKAGQFRDIKRDMPYYQARFHKRLSDKLIDLGYNIKLTEKSFEIEGVPQVVVDLFSKRTDAIGKIARQKGITDAKELDGLGAKTRAKKQKGLSMAELKQDWRSQILKIDATTGTGDAIRFAPAKEPAKFLSQDCINYAVQHNFERASVIQDRRLLATAYRQSVGVRQLEFNEIDSCFETDSRLIHVREKNQMVCTTKEVLKEEQTMVALARKWQGKFQPLYNRVPELQLTGQQADAVEHILTTKNQVSIVRGAAGSGKTTTMREIDRLVKDVGKEVFVVAPTTQAVRDVLVKEGFENAETVSKLLLDKQLQKKLYNQVLMIDESGLLGTSELTALLTIANEQSARLILIGDTRQHTAVTRGDALRIINKIAKIQTAEVSKIYRQKDPRYLAAVEDLSQGKIRDGFFKLDEMSAIKTIDPLKPNDELIKDYMKAVKGGKSTLVVSPTNQQSRELTDELREKLRLSGKLGKKELAVIKYSNLNYTEAERSDWRNLHPGQIIQFNQNVPGVKRGSLWTITEATEKGILLKGDKIKPISLPLDRPSVYDVFKQSEIGLSKGDKVRITRNGFDKQEKRLSNGQSFEVVKISRNSEIELQNSANNLTVVLDKDFGHIEHDYCTTSYSSQGKTVDNVFISQPVSTFAATDAKQFYVSVSRGRNTVTIYTDDKEALLSYASQMGDRQSAIETVERSNPHLQYIQQMERINYPNQETISPDTKELNKVISDYEHGPGL